MKIASAGGPDRFAAGFVFALLWLGVLKVAVRAVQWLRSADVTAAVVAWWTTPVAVTAADVVTSLLLLAVIALLALTTLGAIFGPSEVIDHE